jgi:hypothetical protein
LVAIVVWGLIAYACGVGARAKDRPGVDWFIYGISFTFVALIVLVLLPPGEVADPNVEVTPIEGLTALAARVLRLGAALWFLPAGAVAVLAVFLIEGDAPNAMQRQQGSFLYGIYFAILLGLIVAATLATLAVAWLRRRAER